MVDTGLREPVGDGETRHAGADDDERAAWEAHDDDLSLAQVLDALVADLCERGVLTSADHGLSDAELGRLIIDTYIRFPEPAAP